MTHRASAVLLALGLAAGAALAQPIPGGTYTIKPDGSGHYISPYAAANALRSRGIAGNVVFEIYTGVYSDGQVNLSSVSGAATYTTTFRPATGQSVEVVNPSGAVIYGYNNNNFKFEGLTIRMTSPSNYPAVDLGNTCKNWRFSNCRIYGSYSGFNFQTDCDYDSVVGCEIRAAQYGVMLQYSGYDYNYFANNFIVGWSSFGLYLYNHTNTRIVHNTIVGPGSYAIYDYSGYTASIVDNILQGSSYSLYKYYGSAPNLYTMDYNCHYVPGSATLFYYTGYGSLTLATWRSVYSRDLNSINVAPTIGGGANPHLKTGSPCIGAGTLTEVAVDIDGDARGTTVDIGADEYTSVPDPLNGVYTIKQDGTGDYRSFTAAIGDLAWRGCNGNVTFDVYAGNYVEQANLDGVSTAPYVTTFQAHSDLNGTQVVNIVASGQQFAVYMVDNYRTRFIGINVSGFTSYGYYLNSVNAAGYYEGCDGCLIQGARIEGPNGIYIHYGADDDSIIGNDIQVTSSYGINLNSQNFPASYRNVFANNFITNYGSNGINLGYYHVGTRMYYNTVYTNRTTNYCVYDYYGYNTVSYNNIFCNDYSNASSRAYYKYQGGTLTADDNCYFANGSTQPFNRNGTLYDLAGWRAMGFDPRGFVANPVLASPTNLHLRTASPCRDSARVLAGFTTDIDGQARDGISPDVGADEWTNPGDPMAGVYTIKQAGGGDFPSFGAAFNALQLRGYGGDVQFDVYAGTYNGTVNLEGIGNPANTRLTLRGVPGENPVINAGGASYGFRLYNNQRIHVEGFAVTNFTSYGIWAGSASQTSLTTDSCAFVRNTITGPNGISLNYPDADTVAGNIINYTSSYGIYLNGYTGSPYSRWNVIANNLVAGPSQPLYTYYLDSTKVVYNTLHSTNSYAYDNYYCYNGTMLNNSISTGVNTYCYRHYYGTFPLASDRNNFWANGYANMIYHPSYGSMTLAYWRSITSRDANSISQNPLYVSASNVHLQAGSPNRNAAATVAGYATDVDGDIRDVATPDIGGDEYFIDLGVTEILAPVGNVAVGSSVTPQVKFRHVGGPAGTNWVKMVITRGGTPVYIESTQVTSSVGDSVLVNLPNWVAGPVGSNYAVEAWHKLMPDNVPGNDSIAGTFQVGNVDVGVSAILVPAASTPQGAAVAPAVVVTNYGDFAAAFDLAFIIDNGVPGDADDAAGKPARKAFDALVYDQTVSVTLDFGATDTVVFDTTWLAEPAGDYTAEAQATLANDTDPSNDSLLQAVSVDRLDVGVSAITNPGGNIPRGQGQNPGVKVKNYGEAAAVCAVRFIVRDGTDAIVYDTVQGGILIGVGDSASFAFSKAWVPAATGLHTLEATTELLYDYAPANDSAFGECTVVDSGAVPTAWEPKASMPTAPSGKMQKDGSWLVYNQGNGLVYAAKGYKAGDFYSYDPVADAWTELAPWPLGIENKGPYKGSIACTDGNGTIYATKGNNTSGFWKYEADDSLGTWTPLTDVPLGVSNKKVKGGTDMVYASEGDSHYVYLLKGYKAEFYRYSTVSGTWHTLADAPTGVKVKYDKGSWLGYDGVGRTIYAHKAKYHELYAYNLDSLTWGPLLPGMPLANQQTGKNKKSKDGGSAAYLNGLLYALKGGNTCEFYAFDPVSQAWLEKDTIDQLGPVGRKKRVKGGGDITSTGEVLYAFKGNKSNELWKYAPMFAATIRPARSGVMAGRVLPQGFDVRLGPNPLLSGVATLRYTLPAAGAATVKVVDVAGRAVLTRSLAAGRFGSTQLDLRTLSAGVYLVKFASGDVTSTHKLVIR